MKNLKITQDYVSDQYHQAYFTFTAQEMTDFYREILTTFSIPDSDLKKKKTMVDDLVMNKLEDKVIENELAKMDVIPIGGRKYRYLSDLAPDQSLVVICQFCVLPSGISMKFPTQIPKELFSFPMDANISKDFLKQLLLQHEMFEYQESDQADKNSFVEYDLSYVKDDFLINHLENQQMEMEKALPQVFDKFLGALVGDVIVLDEDEGILVKAAIKKIQNQVFPKLTDEMAQKVNFLGTQTAAAFKKKVKDIFTFSTTVVLLLNFLSEFILQNDEIEFDEYVINHFMDSDFMPKRKKEREGYLQEVKKEIIKEYIIWIINLNFQNQDIKYMDRIREEYEFDKILFHNLNRVDNYQGYLNRHVLETRVLQYCLEEGILDIQL